jgi:hypothetical protein
MKGVYSWDIPHGAEHYLDMPFAHVVRNLTGFCKNGLDLHKQAKFDVRHFMQPIKDRHTPVVPVL